MPERDKWLADWLSTRRLGPPLHVQKFPERIYILLQPISWAPEPSQAPLPSVTAPRGFVTDFASVPRLFWTLLPPDGAYTYAAVLHDFLYWEQSISRPAADEVLKFAMQELKVATTTSDAIYTAVRTFGSSAWDDNARLKSQGEKRVLQKFPDDPAVTWEEWKKRTDVWY
ncbi:hypothetical protein B0E41_00445 [Hydrogenophaga sp. A37]|nr:hypothetical protein B0E41_00445 [Hydrogenophaga sp. A37]